MKYSLLSKSACAVVVAAMAAGSLVVWSNSSTKSRYLRMVPAGLRVSEVLYAREESWGFGPGGNEAGVVMFQLPVDVAAGIERQGITFLDPSLSAQVDRRGGSRHQVLSRWKATPVAVEGSDDDANATLTHDIGKYLNRYGFGFPIDREVTRQINDALGSQGNFVDDDGRRLIIVMPKAAKVAFAYRG